ncbi:MAG: Fe-S protein assembly chaperone HscA [Chitinophagaceae bacterium]
MAKIAINIATGSLQAEEQIVGIDLGTTHSLVAIIHPDTQQAVALKDIDQTTLVPSLIHLGADGQIHVGEAARPFLLLDPSRTIYSVKRLMGKSYNDIRHHADQLAYTIQDDDDEKLVRVKIDNKYYSPIELSSLILRELKLRAEHVLKMPVTKCVITVPAYFNDAQRQATRDAGKLAGLDVLRIVNEPTAASLAYGLGTRQMDSRIVAVYDLGGGTFDVSILRITDGIFDVLSTHGDTYLGGDDFDRALGQHIQTALELDVVAQHDKGLQQEIRLAAEQAKKALSHETQYTISILGRELQITRDTFNSLIHADVERTLNSCRMALRDSQLNVQDIDTVVMVGGSTRVPYVKEQVSAFFGKPVNDTVNPDEVVALGAAVQADILAGKNNDALLLDITPLSLGIETMGGLMDVLIPRNSKIPSKAGRQYTTQKDGQSGIHISIYQGERDLVGDNRKLGEFTLSGIPAMPAGLPKVDIQFVLDADGILRVSAKELRSGVEQSIEIKPQYGLNDADVEAMLLASITHAREDIATRALVEARTEARQLIDQTKVFLEKHTAYISEEEKQATFTLIDQLEQRMAENNKDAILQFRDNLNDITRPFAERVMDIAIGEALKGKNI